MNPLITYLRDLADGGAVLDAHKLRAAANAIERTYLEPFADPAHGRERDEIAVALQRQAASWENCAKVQASRAAASAYRQCAYEVGLILADATLAPEDRALADRPPGRCQHQLTREADKCRHGFNMWTTCERCILSCPQCWDEYDSSASFGPRPTAEQGRGQDE